MRPPAPCSSSRCVLAAFQPLFSPPIEREGGHPHLIEEDGVLLDRIGAALAAGAHELHGLHGDAGQVGVDHEPGDVLVAGAAGLGARDHPDAVGAVVAAHEDLLAVDDVLVAVADGRGGHPGEVGAGPGLGEELPGAHLAPVDRRQERLPLLFRAPDEDRRRAEPPAAVVVGRQREAEAVDFLLEDDGVVDVEPAAGVLLGRARIEPPLVAELAPEARAAPGSAGGCPASETGVRVMPGGTLASSQARTSRRKRCCSSV